MPSATEAARHIYMRMMAVPMYPRYSTLTLPPWTGFITEVALRNK